MLRKPNRVRSVVDGSAARGRERSDRVRPSTARQHPARGLPLNDKQNAIPLYPDIKAILTIVD
jgi:hypothetical protein